MLFRKFPSAKITILLEDDVGVMAKVEAVSVKAVPVVVVLVVVVVKVDCNTLLADANAICKYVIVAEELVKYVAVAEEACK